jgi:hypothetical protein
MLSMKRINSLTKLSVALAFAVLGAISAKADIVFVTSTCSNAASTTVCGSPVNPDWNPNTGYFVYDDSNANSAGFTAAKATTPDKPETPGGRYFSNTFSNTTPELGITLAPALGVPGGIYRVSHVFSSTAQNVSTNIVLGVTNTEFCTLSFNETVAFQRQYGQPAPQQWQFLGFLTNEPGMSNPRITFYFKDGTVSAGTANRLVVDTFRFTLYEPCTDVAPVRVTTGPLLAGGNSVLVGGVTNASAVTVYQDSGAGFVPIGTKTTDIVDGNNTVSVSGLVKGGIVGATQTVGVQEGCRPTAGIIVGGGPSPVIRMALSVREAVDATGPVGADGRAYTTNAARIQYIGASTVMTSQGPGDGKIITPANEWQTVTFHRGPEYWNPVDPTVIWNSNIADQRGTQNDLQGDWATIESIAFAIEDTTDTGPFTIYIDRIMNGDTVIEDFENAPAGMNTYTFNLPGHSGTTGGFLLAGVNDAHIDNTVYDTGTKSLRVRWQWSSLNPASWLRLNTFNVAAGKPNPMFNLNEPVTIRLLIQPQGATPITNTPFVPSIDLEVANGEVVLDWAGAHRLQSTTNLLNWVNVPQVILAPNTNTFLGPWTNTYTDPVRFFRLVD